MQPFYFCSRWCFGCMDMPLAACEVKGHTTADMKYLYGAKVDLLKDRLSSLLKKAIDARQKVQDHIQVDGDHNDGCLKRLKETWEDFFPNEPDEQEPARKRAGNCLEILEKTVEDAQVDFRLAKELHKEVFGCEMEVCSVNQIRTICSSC